MSEARLSRRSVIKAIGGFGAILCLGSFPAASCAASPVEFAAEAGPKDKNSAIFRPNAYVRVDPDGIVTIMIPKPDMGQGVRTSLAMLVAEEMDADWSMVRVEQAPTDDKRYGHQGVGGSDTIRSMHQSMREIGAAARSMLVAAAAKKWNVDPGSCTASKGTVTHSASNKSAGFGDLTADASAVEVPSTRLPLKKEADFRILGKRISRIDNHDVVTGKARFGIDAKIDGMAYAAIARPPAFGGNAATVDDSAARKVEGVIDVQKFGSGVAVIASNTWSAFAGRDALKITWDPGPNPTLDSTAISATLRGAVKDHLPMPDGAKVIEATFDYPYLSHATMEPMNAVADVRENSCTVIAPVQQPDGARGMVAKMLNIPLENVTLEVTLLGGGFGRRLVPDYIAEAVNLSKQFKRPIKLQWSREDDMKNDHYRPACHCSLKGALDASGKAVGWSHQAYQAGGWGNAKSYGDADIPYNIPKAGMIFSSQNVNVPTGAWRSVEHTLLVVSDECFIDELAHAAGKDPVEFRRDMIGDDRLKAVLDKAAELGDWGKPLPAGHGRGIACFGGYGSYAAHVMEVSVQGNDIKVHRVVAVIDPGFVVNASGVEAQMQGACVDGLSTSLRAAITIEKGGVKENSWTDFRWMTMDAMPKIEVHIMETKNDPGGMGEPGYPSGPPALANAIFAATGKRVRKFPIKVSELV